MSFLRTKLMILGSLFLKINLKHSQTSLMDHNRNNKLYYKIINYAKHANYIKQKTVIITNIHIN